ncbi:Peptidase C1A papain C-terminal [Arabidopsis thaliana x Arabidopsis arenosa]|uniref:Peptidase C1A papain C-terminal n=1 Tax=Arabidopsis thaliana x Arabidopsis arenosa TaxID=1240361 RepID=A0A8T1ZPW2_9BRAS|nr:Peptidase C1A papain C-terminal [Arabidopsis thaliana x Arabidopsis arenosa]
MEATDDTTSQDSLVGVGAGGKWKFFASSSKKSKGSGSSSTKKLTPSDELWPKDLPSTYTEYIKSWNKILRAAMHQGDFHLCWAVAIARCMEAWLALRGVVVELSPQHLINNIKNMCKTSGKIGKYDEIKKFLTEHGLVLEKTCPYSGKLKQNCPKSCENCDEPAFKIRDLVHKKDKQVKEEELIQLVNDGPLLAVLDIYESFKECKDEIYQGQTNRKDTPMGLHVVLVTGFGTTPEGVNYWEIQNSWGTGWGQNGFGKIIRKSSRGNNKPSMFVETIQLVV